MFLINPLVSIEAIIYTRAHVERLQRIEVFTLSVFQQKKGAHSLA
jgi:hypothetical protein